MMNETIRVYKLDHLGREVWSYEGRVLQRCAVQVTLQAAFDRDAVQTGKITLERGDIFEETFYSDRWYNIFRISHPDTGDVKGWYCNITRPAVITESTIRSEDLELDLLVYPDGSWDVLDEEAYQALELDPSECRQAEAAIQELLQLAASGTPPFSLPVDAGDTPAAA